MTDDLLVRLTAASKRAKELDEAADRERERRDALIIEARDQGYSWRKVADAASLAVSTCETIISRH